MTRVVVVGGGGAALRACLAAAQAGAAVTLVCKGVAAASGCTLAVDSRIEFSVVNWPMPEPDTPSTYAADLEAVGRGLKDPERLRLFAERSVAELSMLRALGLPFGDPAQARRVQLAGSSHPRGLICPPRFGARLLRALATATPPERLTVLDRTMALEILVEGGRAVGVVVADLRRGDVRVVDADAVVLAAGGAGQVFSLTTNPRDLTGDGFALAHRAGAALAHMEFIQYVTLTVAPIRGYFLLTSLLLRGRVRDESGAEAPAAGDPAVPGPTAQKQRLVELMTWIASRQRAAPSMRVLWDGTGLGAELGRQMPRTCAAFRRHGLDLACQPVEIAVGAHQFLGGVVTDLAARSTVPNLFAAGDVADSVMGADRINGSGIMEALVFGALAGAGAATAAPTRARPTLPAPYTRRSPHGVDRLNDWRRRLRAEMDDVLVVRDRTRLAGLERTLEGTLGELEAGGLLGQTPATTRALHELRSSLTTAREVVRASRRREHDLGLFVTRARL